MGRLLLCVAQLSLTTVIAFAQSTSTAVENFGLVGTWANDCGRHAGPDNEYSTFFVFSDGRVGLRHDFGPDYGNMTYRIVDAKRIGLYRLSLRQVPVTAREVVLDVTMLKSGNRLRVWSSRGSDGNVYVEDGIVSSADGRETGWAVRCPGQWTNDGIITRITFER